MLCPDCGATSALPTRCTNCGRPLAGTGDTPNRPVDDDARDEAAWRWEEDRDDVAWRPAADTVGALQSAKSAQVAWPAYTPVQPPAQGWYLSQIKSVGGLATALYVLLGASMVAAALYAVASFRRAELLDDLLNDEYRVVSVADLESADDFVALAAILYLVLMVGTAVVFVIWFFRARKNVGLFGLHQPSLGQGWAIGGWFCPVVAFWFPAWIAHDIWKGSDASRGARDIGKPLGRSVLITCWWVPFMLSWVLDQFGGFGLGDDSALDSTEAVDDLMLADRLSGFAEVCTVIAGVFAILLVRRITALQYERTAQLWAMSGPPPMWGAPPPVAGGFPVPLPRQAPYGPQPPYSPQP
ncbi:DUF4328 domain-containing protein [Streptomycetaceae bacterium NBC_01309]